MIQILYDVMLALLKNLMKKLIKKSLFKANGDYLTGEDLLETDVRRAANHNHWIVLRLA